MAEGGEPMDFFRVFFLIFFLCKNSVLYSLQTKACIKSYEAIYMCIFQLNLASLNI